jgi:hypothetical protein
MSLAGIEEVAKILLLLRLPSDPFYYYSQSYSLSAALGISARATAPLSDY